MLRPLPGEALHIVDHSDSDGRIATVEPMRLILHCGYARKRKPRKAVANG